MTVDPDREWDDEFDPRNLHQVREVILDALSFRVTQNSARKLYPNVYNWLCTYASSMSNVQHSPDDRIQSFDLYNRVRWYGEEDLSSPTRAVTDNGLQPVLPGFEPPQSSPRRYHITIEVLDNWKD